RRERWDAAERAFVRALRAAQLADDPELVRRAWYDLGMVRRAARKWDASTEAFARAERLSARAGDDAMAMRAHLARMLIAQRRKQAVDLGGLRGMLGHRRWDADIALQAGRVFHRAGSGADAESWYRQAASRAGRDASGFLIRAQAHLGLAMLAARAGDAKRLHQALDAALKAARAVGAPRIIAQAQLLAGTHAASATEAQDRLERALAIFVALRDEAHARQTLDALIGLAEREQWEEDRSRYRLMRDSMQDSGR
ncbi:MAG: hypothetical protein D6794_08420, partial [Deltaproteobacteria bacterium]